MADVEPIFSAVSSNAHHLYTLLQCISFVPKATVLITPDGIRFSVEEGRVIQALAFLDKALFTTYTFNPPAAPNNTSRDSGDDNDSPDPTCNPCFVVSLSALLETLKIFGVNDPSATGATKAYFQNGSPLSITLSETGIKTTCELTTYEPDGGEVDIPLQRDAIIMKVIMRSAWLHNAIVELGATNPNVLKISASADQEPFFALSGSGGPFSESSVEFSIEEQGPNNGASSQSRKVLTDDGTSRSRAKRAKLAPTVTETFLVSPPSSMGSRIKQNYRFSLVQKASRAMAVANKVSIRGDRQGVLSLQFMIEIDTHGSSGASNGTRPSGGALGPTVTFVDFRFVPLLDDVAVDDDSMGELE
ncbi:hypothetical protein APSETT444_010205 [Aspergillus pseudonomiae]